MSEKTGSRKMDDFGGFCYLDVQKTGSTFISKILKESSLLPLLYSGKHSTVSDLNFKRSLSLVFKGNFRGFFKRVGVYRGSAFYFNSVRDPFDYYASLYNYGCDGRGGLFYQLKRNGMESFYDKTENGFLMWVKFILNAENSKFLGEGYYRCGASGIGFLTYRFLRLSINNPSSKLSKITTVYDAFKLYEDFNICKFTIRNEEMRSDVLFLIDNHLRFFINREKVIEALNADRVNTSKSSVAKASMLRNSPVGELVRKKDAFIFETFYPS